MTHDILHIALIGKDDVLASILAEQAEAKKQFRFTYCQADKASAQGADICIHTALKKLDSDHDALDFYILENKEQDKTAENIFYKPFKLAGFLDGALNMARLRRMKQPRELSPHILLYPFSKTIADEKEQRSILLTEKETRFLLAVLDAGAQGFAREKAITDIWGYHPDVDSHAVDTTLYRLRQKLMDIPAIADALHNENGVYRWSLD